MLAASGAAISLLATGCLNEGGGNGGGEPEVDAPPGEEPTGGGAAGDGMVEIFGAFSGEEEAAFNESLAEFEESSGIDVEYVPSSDFTTLIRSRVQGGNPPDIALFPQPGLVLDLAESGGSIIPLGDVLDLASLEETLIPGFLDAATTEDDEVYAAPMRMAVKSIVWYPIPEFEEAGYAVPTSFEELVDLQAQMVADGNTPWCIGMESGADTGWVATDWVEEMVLRTSGPDVYDQWVNHEIPFNAPEIQTAGEAFGDIVFTEGYVLGGPQAMLTIPFGDAAEPMFDEEPACFLHRQGNFITSFFPEDVQEDLGANVGTFVLPSYEQGGFDGQPILGGGDMAAMFNEDEATVAVMEFLTSDEFGGPWAEAGGWLSPHTTFDTSLYANEITQEIAALVAEADVFRFDASDLMPASVGAGSFWDQMVDWISGGVSLEEALTNIEESWPE
jgi:alpha-glucoside transport system substrate-binding protein